MVPRHSHHCAGSIYFGRYQVAKARESTLNPIELSPLLTERLCQYFSQYGYFRYPLRRCYCLSSTATQHSDSAILQAWDLVTSLDNWVTVSVMSVTEWPILIATIWANSIVLVKPQFPFNSPFSTRLRTLMLLHSISERCGSDSFLWILKVIAVVHQGTNPLKIKQSRFIRELLLAISKIPSHSWKFVQNIICKLKKCYNYEPWLRRMPYLKVGE